MFTRKIAFIAMAVWCGISTIYVVYDRWQHFREEELARIADKTRRDVIGEIITQAAQCRPFSVVVGEKSAQLVSVACLQEPGPARAAQPPAPER